MHGCCMFKCYIEYCKAAGASREARRERTAVAVAMSRGSMERLCRSPCRQHFDVLCHGLPEQLHTHSCCDACVDHDAGTEPCSAQVLKGQRAQRAPAANPL